MLVPPTGRHDARSPVPPGPFGAQPYSEAERAALDAKLDQYLGPEYHSLRASGGAGSVHYLEGWQAIQLANEVFGATGWSCQILDARFDYREQREGRVNAGFSVHLRITLRDGTFREDFGYGQIENARSQGAAYAKIRKEATTDAMKRALRQFGQVLGNCIYDKAYVKAI
ncbi:hypothetical protein CXG81DRAFT_11794, partial [Caulochytrium protostelioides]